MECSMNRTILLLLICISAFYFGCNLSDIFTPDPPANLNIVATTPNPFTDSLKITYSVGSADKFSNLRIVVSDRSNRDIAIVVDTKPVNGTHTIYWNGRDINGKIVTGGFYFVELRGWYSSDKPLTKVMIFKEE